MALVLKRSGVKKRKVGVDYDGAARTIQRFVRRKVIPFRLTQPLAKYGFNQALAKKALSLVAMRTKTERTRSQPDPLGGSESRFSLIRPKVKIGNMDKLTEPQVVVQNSAQRLTSLVGKQECGLLATHFSPTQIGSLFSATYGTTGKSTKCLLKSVKATVLITNQENSPALYTIYDCLCRRDGGGTVSDPMYAFQNGMAGTAGGAAANYLVPGVDPYMNPMFNEWFHIRKATSGTLLPGNVHRHEIYYEPNHIISHEIDFYSQQFLADLTHFSFIVFHGTPLNDSATKTQVSIAPINIDVVTKSKLTMKTFYYPLESTSVTNSLALSFGVAGEVINEFTGAAMTDANA